MTERGMRKSRNGQAATQPADAMLPPPVAVGWTHGQLRRSELDWIVGRCPTPRLPGARRRCAAERALLRLLDVLPSCLPPHWRQRGCEGGSVGGQGMLACVHHQLIHCGRDHETGLWGAAPHPACRGL